MCIRDSFNVDAQTNLPALDFGYHFNSSRFPFRRKVGQPETYIEQFIEEPYSSLRKKVECGIHDSVRARRLPGLELNYLLRDFLRRDGLWLDCDTGR